MRAMKPETESYLTVADVAGALGIKPSTVRAYVARKQMPSWNYCPTCGHAPTWARETLAEWRPAVFTTPSD